MVNKAINVCDSHKLKRWSRLELMDWYNEMLQCRLVKIEHLCTGAAYCNLMHMAFPKVMNLAKVKFVSNQQYEYINNFKELQKCFNKMKVSKPIPIGNLIKAHFNDNFEFATWFRYFLEANVTKHQLETYDPVAARGQQELAIGNSRINPPFYCQANKKSRRCKADDQESPRLTGKTWPRLHEDRNSLFFDPHKIIPPFDLGRDLDAVANDSSWITSPREEEPKAVPSYANGLCGSLKDRVKCLEEGTLKLRVAREKTCPEFANKKWSVKDMIKEREQLSSRSTKSLGAKANKSGKSLGNAKDYEKRPTLLDEIKMAIQAKREKSSADDIDPSETEWIDKDVVFVYKSKSKEAPSMEKVKDANADKMPLTAISGYQDDNDNDNDDNVDNEDNHNDNDDNVDNEDNDNDNDDNVDNEDNDNDNDNVDNEDNDNDNDDNVDNEDNDNDNDDNVDNVDNDNDDNVDNEDNDNDNEDNDNIDNRKKDSKIKKIINGIVDLLAVAGVDRDTSSAELAMRNSVRLLIESPNNETVNVAVGTD